MTESPYILDRGRLAFRYHPGQERVMASAARFILLLAGTQSGKTILGAWWLLREIRRCGSGEYMVVSPTYKLMQLKALPEFLALFRDRLGLGRYYAADRVFVFSARGREVLFGRADGAGVKVFFGHAQDPDSLESATAKAAWCDEAGQKKFRYGSWEAIQRRLSIHEGRVLFTTTPYTLGWLKSELHDRARAGEPGYDLIQFRSIMNPAFPRAEYERMRELLPAWKFRMMYDGVFTRPAGMIYDCFTDAHKVPRFPVPDHWRRYAGLDFGGVNTAAVLIATEPASGESIAYRTYREGGRTSAEHARAIQAGETIRLALGGSQSEGQWRREFAAAGFRVGRPPTGDVEVGIAQVYALLKTGRLTVFDDLTELIDEIESYSRAVDDAGEPTEQIEDKEQYHLLDALRYIAGVFAVSSRGTGSVLPGAPR